MHFDCYVLLYAVSQNRESMIEDRILFFAFQKVYAADKIYGVPINHESMTEDILLFVFRSVSHAKMANMCNMNAPLWVIPLQIFLLKLCYSHLPHGVLAGLLFICTIFAN
jgi:hypothetical protein